MGNVIVRHCAPTLAGLKTANLVNCQKNEAIGFISGFGGILRGKGVDAVVLAERENNVLLYVYRRKQLLNDLKNHVASGILEKLGYDCKDIDKCIMRLCERIEQSACFPHEIGLFLGYPAEDVLGFIEHKGQDFKCMGYWKVYCNECEAKKTFERYKKCIDVYTRVYSSGTSIEKLTVAV